MHCCGLSALGLSLLFWGCAADSGQPLDGSSVDAGVSVDAGLDADSGTGDSGEISRCDLPVGDLTWRNESDSFSEVRLLTTGVHDVGCTSYVALLRLEWPRALGPSLATAELEIYLCHTCPGPLTLDYLIGAPDPVPDLRPFSDGYHRSDFVIRAAEPSLGFGLADASGQLASNQCMFPDEILCTEEVGRFVPSRARVLLPPKRVLMLDSRGGPVIRPEQYPIFYDWRNEWRQSVGQPLVEPFDYRGELRLFFDLPHLYPTTTASATIKPERPDQLSCSFSGFPTPRNCGYWLDEQEWSSSDLLQLITPPITLPEELLTLLKQRAGQQ